MYVLDVTCILKGSASFLAESGVLEQPELVGLLFALHLFQLPKRGSPPCLGCDTRQLPCVTLRSFYAFQFIFSVASCPPWPCVLPLPNHTLILCSSSSLPPKFYPSVFPYFPYPTCLTLLCHLCSQRPLSLYPLLHPLLCPFFSFSFCFFLLPFFSLAVPLDFSLFLSLPLSACLCFPTSLLLSISLVSVTGTCISHQSSFTQFLWTGANQSLCYFPGRNICLGNTCTRCVSEDGSYRYIWDVLDFPCAHRWNDSK